MNGYPTQAPTTSLTSKFWKQDGRSGEIVDGRAIAERGSLQERYHQVFARTRFVWGTRNEFVMFSWRLFYNFDLYLTTCFCFIFWKQWPIGTLQKEEVLRVLEVLIEVNFILIVLDKCQRVSFWDLDISFTPLYINSVSKLYKAHVALVFTCRKTLVNWACRDADI